VESDLVLLDAAPAKEGRVKWEPARVEPLSEGLVVTGRIGVNENLTSRVGAVADGRIVAVFANVGDVVKKGQLLAQLHSHEVHDARAEYAKSQAELSRRQAELEFATNARNRASRLYELKATSQEQLQRSETDLRSAQLAIKSAQADINRIQEHLRHLGLSPEGAEEEYTRAAGQKQGEEFEENELVPIVSPIAGKILKRMISAGTVVTPAIDLVLVSDLSSLWVNAEVPEKYLGALRVERPVRISVKAYGDRTFPGRITLIGDTLNPDTRTVQVRCETRNEGGMLKPEMYAMVGFEVGEARQALMIPSSALQDINGSSSVFLRESDTRYRVRRIRTGQQSREKFEILEGLKPGDAVVSTGSFLLKSELLKRLMSGD
jgi:membrane fusion protein, heavy metal efflux system